MGFMSAMKGANNAWARVTANFFDGVGYLGPKNLVDNRAHELMISASSLKDAFVFTKNDVLAIDMICATSEWIKFKLLLKGGKLVIATFMALQPSQRGQEPSLNLLSFESWMMGIIYQDKVTLPDSQNQNEQSTESVVEYDDSEPDDTPPPINKEENDAPPSEIEATKIPRPKLGAMGISLGTVKK